LGADGWPACFLGFGAMFWHGLVGDMDAGVVYPGVRSGIDFVATVAGGIDPGVR
jgi:hypothetical protein